ncbi:MAG: hypothetical protein ABJN98_18830 [Roseibium sp.]
MGSLLEFLWGSFDRTPYHLGSAFRRTIGQIPPQTIKPKPKFLTQSGSFHAADLISQLDFEYRRTPAVSFESSRFLEAKIENPYREIHPYKEENTDQ